MTTTLPLNVCLRIVTRTAIVPWTPSWAPGYAVLMQIGDYTARSSRKGVKQNRRSRPPSLMADRALAGRFGKTVNMSGDEIRRWHKSPLSKRASLPHIRAELPLLAKMKDTPYASWTPAMWNKAARTINFIERHEAQMKVQGKRYGTGKLHVTEKRTVALLNWGRATPGVSLAEQMLDAS